MTIVYFCFCKTFDFLENTRIYHWLSTKQVLPAATLRISFGKSWQLSIYSSRSLVSVSWYSLLTLYKILLNDTAVDTLTFAGLLLSNISAIQTGVARSNWSKDDMKLRWEHVLLWYIIHFNFPAHHQTLGTLSNHQQQLITPGTPSTTTNNTWYTISNN